MSTYVSFRDGGKTSEEGLMRPLKKLLSSVGVMSSTDLAVSQRGAGANKSVDIAAGDAFFTYGDYAYYGWNSAILNSSDTVITDNSSGNPRIDAVVAYIDLTVVSDASSNNPGALKFAVVAGTPAGSPSAPSDGTIQSAIGASNPFLRLANVAVSNGFSSIVNADITDTRILSTVVGNGADGWNYAGEAWSYSSVSGIIGVITVPSDATTKYIVGDSIRIKQGGAYKYFKIVAVTSTTLSVTGGTDYTLTNTPITNNYFSKMITPVGFPDWFVYTPTQVGFTGGTISARFRLVGKTCTVFIEFAAAGTGTSTAFTLSTPITAANIAGLSFSAPMTRAVDNGTTSTTNDNINIATGGSTMALAKANNASGWTASGNRVGDFVISYLI